MERSAARQFELLEPKQTVIWYSVWLGACWHQHHKLNNEGQKGDHLVDSSHFTDEETEIERRSKSLLGVLKWFIWGTAAISSHPIVIACMHAHAHTQTHRVQQIVSAITHAIDL